MLARCVIVYLAVAAFVATMAMLPTVASAGFSAGNWPQPGTFNWPPYAEGGNTPRTTCGYLWVNPYPYKPRSQGRWVYQCR
jgi:hypothetical protein